MPRPGRREETPENHERWLVSYADMLTLLFAVFVVLYASRVESGQAAAVIEGALQDAFGNPFEDIPPDRRELPLFSDLARHFAFVGDRVLPPAIKRHAAPDMVRPPAVDRLFRLVRRLETSPELAGAVRMERDGGTLRLSLFSTHFFDSGSHELKRETLAPLDELLALVKELDRPVTVEGHADALPLRGAFTNWELAALRATRLVRHMLDEHGFQSERLRAVSYGDAKPLARNDTAAGRALNRRVELLIDLVDWR